MRTEESAGSEDEAAWQRGRVATRERELSVRDVACTSVRGRDGGSGWPQRRGYAAAVSGSNQRGRVGCRIINHFLTLV
jgi:hypothetical protein